MNTEPLVSIIVITYNSSKYVLETLDSARLQTYKNIELIISDDCSSDSTVEICSVWLNKNKERFICANMIVAKGNKGIPANCNRGLNASKGEWVKFIAGDDILATNCIESFVDFINQNNNAKIVESKSQFFKNDFEAINFFHIEDKGDNPFFSDDIDAKEQYRILLRHNTLHGPSVFLNKNIIDEVGGFDERFFFIEDHPLWLKLAQAGYRFYFMNRITVYYRVHDSSVFATVDSKKLYNTFYRKSFSFDKIYRLPYLNGVERFNYLYKYSCLRTLDFLGLNRRNVFCRELLKFVIGINIFRKFE